jgi:hypothetical protein
MQTTAAGTTARDDHWIESPLWDGVWLLNGVWLIPVMLVLGGFQMAGDAAGFFTGWGRSLLASGHLLAPILMVYGLAGFRAGFAGQKGRYLWLPAAFLLIPPAVVMLDAANGWPTLRYAEEFHSVKILAVIFVTWNFWHFASHNFGVLSLYRVKAGHFSRWDRTADRWFTSLMMLVLVPLIWYWKYLGLYGRRLFEFLPEPAAVGPLRGWVLGASALLTAAILVWEWRKPNRSVPRMIYLGIVGAQPFLAALAFPVFYALLINLNHWLAELGLIGKIHGHAAVTRAGARGKDGRPAPGPAPAPARRRFALAVVSFAALGFLWDRSIMADGMKRFGSSLTMVTDADFAGQTDVFSAGVLGLGFGINFLHMICDRYLFAFRRPEVSGVLEALKSRSFTGACDCKK